MICGILILDEQKQVEQKQKKQAAELNYIV
jgi:hypothetical protein